jgi:hypothetical protein
MLEKLSNQSTLELCIYDYVITEDHNGKDVYVIYYQHGYRGKDQLEVVSHDHSVWVVSKNWREASKNGNVTYSTLKHILNRINDKHKLWAEGEDGRNACLTADTISIVSEVPPISEAARKKIAIEYFSTPVKFV